VDGYKTAIYFIVLPAVLGPVSAVMFVVAVYLCRRRRQLDPRQSSAIKRAPVHMLRLPVSRLRPPPTTPQASRLRAGVEGGMDEEIRAMLPCASAGLFVNPPTSRVPGRGD